MSATDVLREYGLATRGDWSEIDGRTVRDNLNDFADWIENPDTYPGDETARLSLGLCVNGKGHWNDYCTDQYIGCQDDGVAR